MTILGRTLGVALALLLALPSAQARPRVHPGLILAPLAIVGGIAGAAMGSRKARAHRAHHHRFKARRDRGAIRQARPAAPDSAIARTMPGPERSRAQPAGWAGPLFWPHAYDGIFEYAFGLPGDDDRFWARGFGDVVDGMFVLPAQAAVRASLSNEPPEPDRDRLCGSETPKAAEATVEHIRQAVKPGEAQQASLKELGAALARATERIEAVCPARRAATAPERLHLMIARLTAMRQAVLTVQGPLRTFYEQLSGEQKTRLENAGSEGEASNARADAGAKAGCAAPVATWPEAQIERALRPTKAQRAQLEQLRQISLGMAQFVASTCPTKVPRTAPERLEAVKDRLAVLRYAASNVAPAYEQFYAALSDAQKVRLQAIPGERRAETRR